jgi:hypothetical protein
LRDADWTDIALAADDPSHRRIMAQPPGVVDILVSSRNAGDNIFLKTEAVISCFRSAAAARMWRARRTDGVELVRPAPMGKATPAPLSGTENGAQDVEIPGCETRIVRCGPSRVGHPRPIA